MLCVVAIHFVLLWLLSHYMDMPQCLCLSGDGHLGCFQFFPIMTKAAMNTQSRSLCTSPGSVGGILGNFSWNCQAVSKVVVLFYSPTSSEFHFRFLHILAWLYLQLLSFSHVRKAKLKIYLGSYSISLYYCCYFHPRPSHVSLGFITSFLFVPLFPLIVFKTQQLK